VRREIKTATDQMDRRRGCVLDLSKRVTALSAGAGKIFASTRHPGSSPPLLVSGITLRGRQRLGDGTRGVADHQGRTKG
jgi:hypothetical protein